MEQVHRLFSHITMNWRGRPLTSHEVIIESIAAATTRTGLTVHAELDPGTYPTGIRISKAEANALPLNRHPRHGDWNYTLRPEPPAPLPQPPPPGPGTTPWAHPELTGLTPHARNHLLATIHHHAGDPDRPRQLNLAEETLITILSLRHHPLPATLAQLFAVTPGTIIKAQNRTWPLLLQAGHPTEPAGPRLKTLTDLTAHAQAHGITLTPKTAC
jgi:hypothetical protein